jgi:hypothetical protein
VTIRRLTLLSDGPTDQALLPVVRWTLQQHSTAVFEQNWADLRRWPRRPEKLAGKVDAALDLYPCDLLVVHRDAEREPAENRLREIAEATRGRLMPVVCAVPVRMTEAWLLFDEQAIRRAAGCPNGTTPLDLPPLKNAESVPDPKALLHQVLRVASDLSGRRRKQLRPDIRRLADLIDDFAPLRAVRSFQAFEESLCDALRTMGLLGDDAPPSTSA